MALDPQWRRSRRVDQPGINDASSAPRGAQWAIGAAGLLGVLGLLYYLSVSASSFNFFVQAPP
jgi:hypothetical protein